MSWFFPGPEAPDSEASDPDSPDQNTADRSIIVRRAERRAIAYDDGIRDELLTPGLGGKLELLSCRFAPGSGVDTVYAHEGEEAGLVLSGVLDLWVGDAHHRLEAGDSFAFDSATPHRYRNPSETETIVIWALTPPSF